MTRDSVIPNGDMTPGFHLPWPFFGMPPLRQIESKWLTFDALFSLAEIAVASVPFGQWVYLRSRRLKLAIIGLSVACGFGWFAIAFSCYVYATHGSNSSFIASHPVAFVAFLWITKSPSVISLIFILIAIGRLIQWALPYKKGDVSKTLLLLFDGVLLALFIGYIVNDAFYFGESMPLLSLSALGTVLILPAIGTVRRIVDWLGTGTESDPAKLGVNERETRDESEPAKGSKLTRSIGIATLVVGWTTVYFAFFDLVTFECVGNGQLGTGALMLDAYGWPWVYMAEYDSTAELRELARAEGYPIDIFRLGPLVADVLFVLFVLVGTWITLMLAARRGTLQPRFSLRSLLLLFIALLIALYLPHAGGYYILWPNWFATAVLYFATACASFGTLLVIDCGINRYLKRLKVPQHTG